MSSRARNKRNAAQSAPTAVALVLLLLTSICSPAMAGRNHDGAMLLHVNNALTYSQLQDYCNDTTYPLPQTCDGLITNITKNPVVEAMVWMVAAFPDASSPGVNAYQVGLAGDVTFDYFTDSSPCGPGFFEIPDATWPGTGAGTAVAYSATVYSRLFKMYWFAVGAPGVGSSLSTCDYYLGDHHAEWADDSTPPATDFCTNFGTIVWGGAGGNHCPPNGPTTGACCLPDGHCADLAQDACGSQGGTFEGVGTACVTFQCLPPLGACCYPDGTCQDMTQAACGGVWEGIGTACATYLCPPPHQTGACCVGQTCTIETEANCTAAGGAYKGDGSTCEPQNPCVPAPTGACCLAANCAILTQFQCQQQGGIYRGDDTSCDPNPCCTTGRPSRLEHPSRPTLFVGGSGAPNVVRTTRDPCWSEPADLNGLIGSSEQILSIGLETEIANDFVPTGEISHATWWGGYYNNSAPCQSGITTPGFNLRIYDDAGCVPGTILADIVVTDFTEESACCQASAYPMFKWDADISVATAGGTLYWFGAQIGDHPFPPEGGRLASAGVVGCGSVFKSAYFGYPDWTPVVDVFGVDVDFSQEFECGIDTRTGACCFQDGRCVVLTRAACNQQGGSYRGHDSLCQPNPCPAGGACCFADGHCMLVTQTECEQLCGTYQGDNTACVPNPCSSRGFVGRETSYAPLRSNPFARGNGAPLFLGGRNAGGAMLLHVDNSVCYSPGTDYCSADPLPSTCEGLITNATRDPSVEALIWMVAAFPSNSSPGVNAFQVGITGDIPVNDFAAFGSCGPGVLEIPDPTWPSPGTGTACAFTNTVYDRLFKMYWFAVTAPGTGSSLSTTGYPHGDQNAEWADDSTPPRVDVCNNFGRVVWGGHGQNQCPGPIHEGACCFADGSCKVLEQSECTGRYMGDNTVCDPNPCPPAVPGPNANGAMVVHTDDAVTYSAGWDYCAQNPLPGTCGDLTTQTDKPVDTVESIIWVVGAWNPTASPAVAGFQFGIYHNLPAGHFSAWAPCGPGALEIPDATWPNESGTGTAVAFNAAVHPPNNLLKLYWFAAVGVTDGFVSSGAYPHGPMVAQFVDDGNPPKTDDVHLFGTVRWGAPGQNQCPCLAGTSVVLPTEWDVQWNENDNGSVRWYLGGGDEFDVHTIDGNSLRLNDTVAPLGAPVIIPSMEGFEGPVLIARFQRGEAVRSLEDQTPGPKSVFLTGSAGTGCLRATCSINLIDSGHYGTSDQDGAQSSSVFAVGAAHPNPMNAATACQISVPHVGTVTAEVYAVDGRLIRSLLHQALPQGQHIVTWDGRADDGRPVSTGVYFIRVRYEGRVMEQRFTVLH